MFFDFFKIYDYKDTTIRFYTQKNNTIRFFDD